ncbi:MAG: T6SS amidase immunity protein Tai4 family protein [Proteobacteria bacterium]|nr:T6SS amidase immunity protein Tai4 family protein [Pseudomonadota bacterium]
MDTKLKLHISVLGFIMLAFGHHAHAQTGETVKLSQSMTEKYSQKTLLKNWALSVCLAMVSKDASIREDANSTASAYLEFGRQPIEAYDALRKLVEQYANRKYGSSIKSDLNTMKCIDLFHSKELKELTNKLSRNK